MFAGLARQSLLVPLGCARYLRLPGALLRPRQGDRPKLALKRRT